jgi:hypothetical protein
MRNSILKRLTFVVPMASLLAQTPALQINTMYQCGPGQTFKVLSCAGNANTDQCDVQPYTNGQPVQRGPAPRQQVMTLLSICHVQSAAEAKGGAAPAPAKQTVGVGGFKVGDTVQINTAFGWANAKVLQVNGANYYVHAETGADVWKPYPSELRRIGPLNAEDHAHGLYDLHDRVQVLFEGKWVDSEVVTTRALGQEYEVTLPGNRTVWATTQNLRFVSVAPPKPVTKAGVPPKPGFTSCAGKIEGRYGTSNGGPGPRIVFQAGKASVDDVLSKEERECWINGNQIILRLVGDITNGGQDIDLDLNKDGTLDSAVFGELKKKN